MPSWLEFWRTIDGCVPPTWNWMKTSVTVKMCRAAVNEQDDKTTRFNDAIEELEEERGRKMEEDDLKNNALLDKLSLLPTREDRLAALTSPALANERIECEARMMELDDIEDQLAGYREDVRDCGNLKRFYKQRALEMSVASRYTPNSELYATLNQGHVSAKDKAKEKKGQRKYESLRSNDAASRKSAASTPDAADRFMERLLTAADRRAKGESVGTGALREPRPAEYEDSGAGTSLPTDPLLPSTSTASSYHNKATAHEMSIMY